MKTAAVLGSGRKAERDACKRARTIDRPLKQPREITQAAIVAKDSFSALSEGGRDRQRTVHTAGDKRYVSLHTETTEKAK